MAKSEGTEVQVSVREAENGALEHATSPRTSASIWFIRGTSDQLGSCPIWHEPEDSGVKIASTGDWCEFGASARACRVRFVWGSPEDFMDQGCRNEAFPSNQQI